MRMLCAALAALMLLLAGCAASCEAADPLSDLTLEELYALRARLDERIQALESADDGEEACFGSGQYLVGRDIPEGDYAIQEATDAMFASVVVREGETEESSLIFQKLVTGQVDLRLRRDTWVTLTQVNAWPLGQEPSPAGEDGTLPEGAYLVGVQLAEGRYTVSQQDMAPLSSYSIYGDVLGTGAQLLKFEVLHEAVSLELQAGEYIELSGCELVRP